MRGLLKDHTGQQCLRVLCLRSEDVLARKELPLTSALALLVFFGQRKGCDQAGQQLTQDCFLAHLRGAGNYFF